MARYSYSDHIVRLLFIKGLDKEREREMVYVANINDLKYIYEIIYVIY